MKFLREKLDSVKPLFEKGGKYENLYYPFEAIETFLFSPNHTTPNKGSHVRDAIDLKRLMTTVIVAMIPCLLFGMWNVGYQHFIATGEAATFGEQFMIGLVQVLPIVVVAYGAGLGVEFVFSVVRKHPINEGFLVSGMLIPLIMPVTIPLWQVALATIFAVVIGKEVFGGTGMNILNVALTARAFLYFAYPTDISGEVWTYLGDATAIEGYSGATPLALAQSTGAGESVVQALQNASYIQGTALTDLFFGLLPGSIGETSTLMCLIGAAILIITGVGSWKIIVSAFAGAFGMGLLFNVIELLSITDIGFFSTIGVFFKDNSTILMGEGFPNGSISVGELLSMAPHPYLLLPAQYQLVIGGLAFGIVFMATDPVTATHTELGKWIYGTLIGVLTVIIRVVNPAYPEGIMLAILLMNVFAPLIDHYIVQANKNRRLRRATV